MSKEELKEKIKNKKKAKTVAKETEKPGKGHNSGGIAGKQLRQFVDSIERLEEDKRGIAEDIKDIYVHAKSVGFDPKIMRKAVALRKRDKDAVEEEQSILDTYMFALGDGDE